MTRDETGSRRAQARTSSCIIATFVVLLWLPLLVSLAQPDHAKVLEERREAAALPSWPRDWESLASLPAELEAYYDDQLGFRRALIRANAYLRIRLLGASPSEHLIVGKDGWFFLDDPVAVAQYRGLARFTRDELRRWADALEERRAWLAQRGIAYLLAIVPNKHTVYGELMPDHLTRVSQVTQLDQFLFYMRRRTQVSILDLREPLLRAKEHLPVYPKTDMHWNDFGAYRAYGAILRAAEPLLPGWQLDPPVDVVLEQKRRPGGQLVEWLGLARVFREESVVVRVAEPRAHALTELPPCDYAAERGWFAWPSGRDDPRLPRAVVFRDSYANAMLPFLVESFDRVLFAWTSQLHPAVVECARPHIVIQEIVERFLVREPVGLDRVAELGIEPKE